MVKIRQADIEDMKRISDIYDRARSFMRSSGNPNQWPETKRLSRKTFMTVPASFVRRDRLLLPFFPLLLGLNRRMTAFVMAHGAIMNRTVPFIVWLRPRRHGVRRRPAFLFVPAGIRIFVSIRTETISLCGAPWKNSALFPAGSLRCAAVSA